MNLLKQNGSFSLIALSATIALFVVTGTTALGTSPSSAVLSAAEPSPEADTVEVVLKDGDLNVPATVATGEVTFVVKNQGRKAHGFALSGPVDSQLEERLGAGQESSFTEELESGSYTAYCPLEGHAEQESTELQVE